MAGVSVVAREGARVEPGVCEGRCEEWFRRVAGTTPTLDAAQGAGGLEEGLRELQGSSWWRRSCGGGRGRAAWEAFVQRNGPVPGG